MEPKSNLPKSPMDRAIELAQIAASLGEVPVGAVVVHDGKIIGEGHNRRESNQDPLGHAEIIAIQAAAKNIGSWRLNDCELWVTLEPCPMCLGASQQARLKKVIYGATDPKGGALSLGFQHHDHPKLNHRFEVEFRETAICSEMLSDFFRQRRKIN